MKDTPTALYRHFNKKGKLLYVGISKDPFKRTTEHVRQKEWIKEVQTITIKWYETRYRAKEAEDIAIVKEKPVYNILGVPFKRSIFSIVSGGIDSHGRTELVVPISLNRKAEDVVDGIKDKMFGQKQLIIDILFVYSQHYELFQEFYGEINYREEEDRRIVLIPASKSMYSHFKSIEYHCDNNFERTVEALFLFYEANGFKIPPDVNGR